MNAKINREQTAWKDLPNRIKEAVARYIFKSAIKSNVAVLLFRCEKKGWHKDKMRDLFFDLVCLYQMEFFGQRISDIDLIERYEKMLDIDFDTLADAVEVKV